MLQHKQFDLNQITNLKCDIFGTQAPLLYSNVTVTQWHNPILTKQNVSTDKDTLTSACWMLEDAKLHNVRLDWFS